MKSRTLDSLSLFIGKVFDAGIMFIFNIVAARLVGMEQYGIYVFISSTIMLISIMLKLGLDQGITVLVPRYADIAEKAKVITTALFILYAIIAVVLISILLTSGSFAATILNDASYSTYLTYYAPILLILPFTQVAEGIFRSVYEIRYYVIGKSILMPIGIMGSFLILYYAFSIEGLKALFLCNYVGFGAGALFMLWHMGKEELIQVSSLSRSFEPFVLGSSGLDEKINTKITKETRKSRNDLALKLLTLSLPLIFLGLHEYLIGRTDAFVIGYFLNESNVGVFNIADKVAYIASFILVASGSIVAPEISRHYHDKEFGLLAQVYHESTKLLVLVNTLVFFGLVIISQLFMDLTTGGGYDGWLVLIFLSLAYLLHSFFGPVAYMNSMTGGHQMEFRIALIMIISNIALDIIFLRFMGIKGIALATVIVFLIGDLYRANDMYQKMTIRPSFRNAIIPIYGIAIYAAVRLTISNTAISNQFTTVLVEAAVYAIIYIIVIYIAVITKEEKQLLRQLMKHR